MPYDLPFLIIQEDFLSRWVIKMSRDLIFTCENQFLPPHLLFLRDSVGVWLKVKQKPRWPPPSCSLHDAHVLLLTWQNSANCWTCKNEFLTRGLLKCMILVGPLFIVFQLYCVPNTFGIIIIGPKTDRCKLGLFCLEAMETWTVQETTDKRVLSFSSFYLRIGRKKRKVKASIIHTSGGALSQGSGALRCFIHTSYYAKGFIIDLCTLWRKKREKTFTRWKNVMFCNSTFESPLSSPIRLYWIATRELFIA